MRFVKSDASANTAGTAMPPSFFATRPISSFSQPRTPPAPRPAGREHRRPACVDTDFSVPNCIDSPNHPLA
jgi:hypothetical protein